MPEPIMLSDLDKIINQLRTDVKEHERKIKSQDKYNCSITESILDLRSTKKKFVSLFFTFFALIVIHFALIIFLMHKTYKLQEEIEAYRIERVQYEER